MEKKRKGVVGFAAKVLNEAGGALVDMFDLGERAVNKVGRKLKKAPKLGKKARKIVDEGIESIRPERKAVKKGETNAIENKIKEKEDKIEGLYREIGKEGVSYAEAGAPLDSDTVKSLISDVKEYEKEITRLRDRVEELDAQKDEGKLEGLKPEQEAAYSEAPEGVAGSREQDLPLQAAMAAAIETGLRSDVFEFASEKAKFEKVAEDLLDSDMEIKILAVAELGRMKNKAAVPVLGEAVKFEEPHLTLEIVNALIDIGDSSAVRLFKDRVQDSHYRVRVACLRGLYKLAAENDDEAIRILLNALQDDHPDVRKSGATFLGWKGNEEAVPALVQGLKDEDEKVTKAALAALAAIRDKSAVLPLIKVLKNEDIELKKKALDAIKMITGEEIVFDLQAGDAELDKAIGELVDWWQKTRMGEAEIDQDLAFPDADQPEPEPEPEAEADEPWEPEPEGVGDLETGEAEAPESGVVEEPEAESMEETADETPKETEEGEPEAETLTQEELLKKLKSELIAICNDLDIDCDEKLTKAEIADLIVEHSA